MAEADHEKPMGPGPSHISDPLIASEFKRAQVWVLLVGFVLLCVYLAHSLLVIFAGMVFAAMIDGGARLLGRVLDIRRGWRVAIVLIAGVAFLVTAVTYAGTTIAAEASALPHTVQQQLGIWVGWARSKGFDIDINSLQSFSSQVLSGVGTVTRARDPEGGQQE